MKLRLCLIFLSLFLGLFYSEFSRKILAPVHFISGNQLAIKRDFLGSDKQYSKAIELDGDFAEAYYNRGYGRDERGDFRGAVADYSMAIKIDDRYSRAFNNRGYSRAKMGDYKRALEGYSTHRKASSFRSGM